MRTLTDVVSSKTQDEHGYLQWFRLRTAIKLRGSFEMRFWDTLVLRASLHEPAIFHAMMALSSMQKRCSTGTVVDGLSPDRDPDLIDRFTLRHYSNAINLLLQPRFASGDKESVRVTLIACMLFICVEFLRGNYATGNKHLQNGVRILELLPKKQRWKDQDRHSLSPNASGDDVDVWIIQVFSRMNLIARQFGQGCNSFAGHGQSCYRPPPITFESIDQARDRLDDLFDDIIYLQKQPHQEIALESASNLISREELYANQRRIQASLDIWFDAYEASRVTFEGQLGLVSEVGHRLLYLYHIMGSISADTCLRPGDEMSFDSHSPAFKSIILHALKVLMNVRRVHELISTFRHESGSSRFTPDIGWILPLYYTAIHCRVHRIRLQAIRLLRVLPSKEGILDSRLASVVAEEVMRIEEGDFYKDNELHDDFTVDSLPQDSDLNLPTLPSSCRIHTVEIKFPDGTPGRAIMTYKRSVGDGAWETINKEYNIVVQSGTSGEWS